MEICQSEKLLEFTTGEAECLRFIHKLMNDDEDLQHLIKFWTNELVLIMIRSFKLNPHKIFRVTKRLLHCCTKTFPDLFSLVDSTKLEPTLAKKMFQRVNMGECTQSPGIIVFRFNRWNPDEVSVDEAIAAGILYIYEASKDAYVQRNGGMFVMDADGIEFSHVRRASFDVIKKLNCLLNALPLKFVGCVVINCPPVVETLFNILKYALRARNRKLVSGLTK
ncbi:Alpha-tocopherol transfer protein [Folsomia candida]|uniref:Alpha-tocopherol transfer protein n=1 Tax=Folsomia candida TaxID=158441 RepID=A0A226EJ50_FOLCA|nr:Alpha-tocopherol transfer protein [Folsomia candida]